VISVRKSVLFLAFFGLLTFQSSQSALRRYNVPPPPEVAAARAGVPVSCSQPVGEDWIAKVNRLRWVAYSSPNFNAEPGYFQPTPEAVRADLTMLKKAGFNALVTYASVGVMIREFPAIAETLGFKGLILGIWNPRNQDELIKAAEAASATSIVLGYSIGNEGLYDGRMPYDLPDLCEAIAGQRARTGLPVTTSEQFEDYEDHPELLLVGDWVFPIVHPYWHATKDAQEAVAWQKNRYGELARKINRFIFFKEVGLPTSGALSLNEENHDQYYRELGKTDVRFVYFEGFDQPSKTHSSVEPHWGLFYSDRRPKLLAWNLIGVRQFISTGSYDGWIRACARASDAGCDLDTTGSLLYLGSGPENRRARAFLVFDTHGLPGEALITSVKVKVLAQGVEGFDPLKYGRRVRIDICPQTFGRSPALRPSDFGVDLVCYFVGLFQVTPVNGWYNFDFDPAAFASINLSGATRLRLSIAIEEEASMKRGYIKFYSGDAETAYRPTMVVRYSIP
jgi:exo-beta-1,3-glucanase (GH17 family)